MQTICTLSKHNVNQIIIEYYGRRKGGDSRGKRRVMYLKGLRIATF